MALYKRGRFWWISMWRGGRHISVSTKLEEKKRARAVEAALKLTGSAEDGAGTRLTVGTSEREGAGREFILGLLSAVYGDAGDGARVESLWDEYLEVQKVKGKTVSPKGLRDKASCFAKFCEWAKNHAVRNIVQVDGTVAQRYALGLVGTCSSKRRRNVLAHLSAVWNAVMPNHRCTVNPWAVVIPAAKFETERVGFTREEEERVLAAAKAVHEQWFVASMIARHTGLRYGDVCRLEWGEVDLANGLICVRPHKTKDSSGVDVVIPMAGVLKGVLEDWKKRWEPDRVVEDGMERLENGRFKGKKNETNSRTQISKSKTRIGVLATDRVLPWLREYGPKDARRFATVLVRAGLDPKLYSFHSWRHTQASRLGDAGIGIETRKRILGHTTNEMARHYDHSQHISEMRRAVEAAAV